MKSNRTTQILQWIGALIFLLATLIFFPSLCSLFCLLSAILLFPPLRSYIESIIKKPIRIATFILCMLLTVLLVPKESNNVSNTPVDIVLEESEKLGKDDWQENAGSDKTENASVPTAERFVPEVNTSPMISPVTELTFAVHFIDVGQGDASLILCDGKSMLIDGGTPSCSSLIVSYLRKQSVSHLDYVIASHAHEDHAGGLSGALNACTVGKVYAPVTEYEAKAFNDLKKYTEKQGIMIEKLEAGDTFMLGNSFVSVLSPSQDHADHNDDSIVLKITFGQTSFLFTGDANGDAEQVMLSAGVDLGSTVLKVGHHGSDDATSYVFLREVMPHYAVISCGAENSYGHPTDAVLSRLRDADTTVFRTDLQGDIICISNGKDISFTTEKQVGEIELLLTGDNISNQSSTQKENVVRFNNNPDAQKTECNYIGNSNSRKFHRSTCNSLPIEKNRVCFMSREEALDGGYTPCKTCNP